jgi:hypothetical protein
VRDSLSGCRVGSSPIARKATVSIIEFRRRVTRSEGFSDNNLPEIGPEGNGVTSHGVGNSEPTWAAYWAMKG